MASDVMTLFNMPTQQELGQRYLDSQMISPAQMGNQGLLQQVVSMGGNAGAGLGYAGGRLFGGATPDQVRARGIDEAMRTVQGLGLTSDAEMYAALSKELGARGLTQDAFMANKEARTAMREEQVMKKGGLDISKANLDIQTATLQLKKSQQDMLQLEQRLALSTDPEERKGLQRALDAATLKIKETEGDIAYKVNMGDAALRNSDANISRASQDAAGQKYTQAIYDEGIVPGTKGATPLGYRNATTGKIRDVSTNEVYDNLDQLKQARALRGAGPATEPAKPAGGKEKPTMDIAERAAQLTAGQGGQAPAAQVDNTKYSRTKNNRGQYVYSYSPRGGKTKAEWATIE
jgi:hypothetical protein